MKYFKVKIFEDGSIEKEELKKEETEGTLGFGIYFHSGPDGNYNFFVESETRVQKAYTRFIKSRIKEHNEEIKRLQTLVKKLKEAPTII